MDDRPIDLTIDRGVATISLNRPEALNGIDLPMALALLDAINEVHEHPGLKCLLIRANGSAFSVGGDLRQLAAHTDRDRPAALRTW